MVQKLSSAADCQPLRLRYSENDDYFRMIPDAQPNEPKLPLMMYHHDLSAIAELLGHCSSSAYRNNVSKSSSAAVLTHSDSYLPPLHLSLFGVVLFDQILQNLAQPFGVRFQSGHNVFDCPFNKDTVN